VKGALDVHRELLARGVPHEMVRLPGRATTADDLPRLLGLPSGCVAVRCYEAVRPEGVVFVAVLVPAGREPHPDALRKALGAEEVRPARAEAVNAVTDFSAGLVSPVGLPPEVELLADAALGASDVSYCPVGEGEVVLGIRTRDLLVATGARAASLTAVAPASRVLDLDRRSGARSTG
jgi:prolyl-tRNA editing enzyme YbaK/EbsC (Cys-tRNA(Pro) deacylase)